jgi:pyrroline-5-carboxylate reductase
MPAKLNIGFIGAGQMATALAKGFVKAGLVKPDQVLGSDPMEDARAAFEREVGARITAFNPDVPKFASVFILAVKPAQVPAVLKELRGHINEKHLLVSLAAGVPLVKLEEGLETGARVVRVMPNTPALVGASASAYALGRSATAEDGQLVQKLLSAVGLALQVPEPLLDAVTGLSGSGPAYVYLVIEALADGGVRMGLTREVALTLAAQTVFGAAKMVLDTNAHPALLKDLVASPGGTTIAGLHALERGGLRAALMNAVEAASARSKELGSAT